EAILLLKAGNRQMLLHSGSGDILQSSIGFGGGERHGEILSGFGSGGIVSRLGIARRTNQASSRQSSLLPLQRPADHSDYLGRALRWRDQQRFRLRQVF